MLGQFRDLPCGTATQVLGLTWACQYQWPAGAGNPQPAHRCRQCSPERGAWWHTSFIRMLHLICLRPHAVMPSLARDFTATPADRPPFHIPGSSIENWPVVSCGCGSTQFSRIQHLYWFVFCLLCSGSILRHSQCTSATYLKFV